MAEPVVLSGSSLNTFIECPKEWELLYLWRIQRVPSFKMALGTAAHFAVETAMRERLASGRYPHLSVWTDAFMQAWDKESSQSKPRNDRADESRKAYTASGISCVTFYAADIAPGIIPVHVEMPIRFSINGHVWTGTADLLAQGERSVILVDHKFTGERPRNKTRYRYPMIGYAVGVRHKLGVIEEDVVTDYVIRNKKPVHFPVANGGPVTDEDILDLAQQVEDTHDMIARGSFPPVGRTNGACNWCPCANICPDVLPEVRNRRYGPKP